MTTTAFFDYSLSGQVIHAGASPINAGIVSLPIAQGGRINFAASKVIAKEIVRADVVLSAGYYLFQMENDDADQFSFDGTNPVLDLTGSPVTFFNGSTLFYLETNAPADISGLMTDLPASIDANGFILINSTLAATAPVGAGEIILELAWSEAAMAAIGEDNFRARLIICST
jgi:hypothetical protein